MLMAYGNISFQVYLIINIIIRYRSNMKYNQRNYQQNIDQANISKRTLNQRQFKTSRSHNQITSNICYNHDNKSATHIYINQQNNQYGYYCEKCSIMLASKGFNVVKINQNKIKLTLNATNMKNKGHQSRHQSQESRRSNQSSAHNSQRMSEIKEFLSEVVLFNRQLQQKNKQLRQTLIVSQQQYTQLIQKVNRYFSQIEQTLQLQKYLCYNDILSKRTENQNQTRELKGNVQSALSQITIMINDIISNEEVVESVDDKLYDSIMASYRHKLDIINQVLTVQANYPFKFQVSFPQLSKQILQIADKIQIKGPNSFECECASQQQNYGNDKDVVSPYFLTPNAQGSKQKNEFQQQKIKTLYNLKNLTNQQLAFSYDSSQQNYNFYNDNIQSRREYNKFPLQILMMNSLDLTQIQDQLDDIGNNRRQNQQDFGFMTSQQSLGVYYKRDDKLDRSEEDSEIQNQAQTLLIS